MLVYDTDGGHLTPGDALSLPLPSPRVLHTAHAQASEVRWG